MYSLVWYRYHNKNKVWEISVSTWDQNLLPKSLNLHITQSQRDLRISGRPPIPPKFIQSGINLVIPHDHLAPARSVGAESSHGRKTVAIITRLRVSSYFIISPWRPATNNHKPFRNCIQSRKVWKTNYKNHTTLYVTMLLFWPSDILNTFWFCRQLSWSIKTIKKTSFIPITPQTTIWLTSCRMSWKSSSKGSAHCITKRRRRSYNKSKNFTKRRTSGRVAKRKRSGLSRNKHQGWKISVLQEFLFTDLVSGGKMGFCLDTNKKARRLRPKPSEEKTIFDQRKVNDFQMLPVTGVWACCCPSKLAQCRNVQESPPTAYHHCK